MTSVMFSSFLHEIQPLSGLDVPYDIANRIKAVTAAWPVTVDKIVTLASA